MPDVLDPRVTEGTVLRSALDTGSEQYRANRAAQLALLDQLDDQLDAARARGRPRPAARLRAAGGAVSTQSGAGVVGGGSPGRGVKCCSTATRPCSSSPRGVRGAPDMP